MGPVQAISTCFRKYAVFSGRASRSEYWWFFAFTLALTYASVAIDTAVLNIYALGQPMKWVLLAGAMTLITLLPVISVGYRRLQDTGMPGWIYVVLTAIAYSQIFFPDSTFMTIGMVMSIALVVLCIRKTAPGPNTYGPNPHEVTP